MVNSESFTIGLGNNDTKTRLDATADYVAFWEKQAQNLTWFEKWSQVLEWNVPFARWFFG
jgi:acetyl-CoA synthetase